MVPRPGYPFEVDVTAGYALDDAAPVSFAGHPYLLGASGPLDTWTLEVPAERVMEVTPDRLVPRGVVPVAGDLDLRRGRQLRGVELDHAFTGLRPDPDGRVRARVVDADGHGAQVVWDPGGLLWVQVHTADLPDPAETRLGVALEPMTGPPDALNSGTDLLVLGPGERVSRWWCLAAV